MPSLHSHSSIKAPQGKTPSQTHTHTWLHTFQNLLLLIVCEMKIQLQLEVHLTQGFFHLQDIG